MRKKILIVQSGFTIIELMITMVISVIVIAGVGVLLVDGQRGWNKMYDRVHGKIATDSYVARIIFDRVIRKARKDRFLLDDNGSWIKVYYYANDESSDIDRYAYFLKDNTDLIVEYGEVYFNGQENDEIASSVSTLCNSVSDCIFTKAGRSAQMILTLDNGITTVTTAYMHNP